MSEARDQGTTFDSPHQTASPLNVASMLFAHPRIVSTGFIVKPALRHNSSLGCSVITTIPLCLTITKTKMNVKCEFDNLSLSRRQKRRNRKLDGLESRPEDERFLKRKFTSDHGANVRFHYIVYSNSATEFRALMSCVCTYCTFTHTPIRQGEINNLIKIVC